MICLYWCGRGPFEVILLHLLSGFPLPVCHGDSFGLWHLFPCVSYPFGSILMCRKLRCWHVGVPFGAFYSFLRMVSHFYVPMCRLFAALWLFVCVPRSSSFVNKTFWTFKVTHGLVVSMLAWFFWTQNYFPYVWFSFVSYVSGVLDCHMFLHCSGSHV